MIEQTVIRAERKAKAIDLLGGVCVECGTTNNLVFDHIANDRADLQHNISYLLRGRWVYVVAELQKCQLLCVSCHAIKTLKDRGVDTSIHGIKARYNQGCRCDACRAVASILNKRYAIKRKALAI